MPAEQHVPVSSDALLRGAIDLHHHGYPEIGFDVRTRHDDVTEFTLARDAGMRGIVLKSHMWPTVGRAYHIARAVPGIEVFPSITLNPIAGGLDPMAVEVAARQGARVMFFPTWGAAHDRARGGFGRHLQHFLRRAADLAPDGGITVTDASGRLRGEAAECLAVAAEFGMLVCTAHLSPRESIAVAQRAKDYGIARVVFSHPDSFSVGATRDDIREMAALGAVCELCALGMLPAFQRISAREAMEIAHEIGPANAVLTTDYFFEWAPPAAETLRMVAGTLVSLGMAPADVRAMLCDTPARLLGLAPEAAEAGDAAPAGPHRQGGAA